MRRYTTSNQVVVAEVQSSDPLRMAMATCDSLPLAEVTRIVPRAQGPKRILNYLAFEVKQCEAICFVREVNSSSSSWSLDGMEKLACGKEEEKAGKCYWANRQEIH